MSPKWDIHHPEALDEACAILERYGDDCRPYAGGTELVLLLKFGLASPGHLLDLKRLGLRRVRSQEGKELAIDACVTHYDLERSELVQRMCPLLSSVETEVANIRVRAVGTIGGNLCFAEPSSDIGTILMLAGARLHLVRAGSKRTVLIDDFLVHSFTTVMDPAELLTTVDLPAFPAAAGVSYQRIALGERPSACVGCLLVPEGDRIAWARLVVGSAHPTPIRVKAAEQALVGLPVSGECPEPLLQLVADVAATTCEPHNDVFASAVYKRSLVRVLVRRAVNQALSRVG